MMKLFEKTPEKFTFHKTGFYTFLNPYSYLHARKHKDVYKNFDGIYIDGQWLVYFLSFFKIRKATRASFDYSSIADEVFNKVCELKLSVAIIGSKESFNKQFCEFILKKYPNISIKISKNGYLTEGDNKKLIHEIKNKDIQFVLVGMGSPMQEKFLVELKQSDWNGLAYTCGGFIHQTASRGGDYYPNIIDKYNLRFIYRIYDEPKLLKRYLIEYPKFVLYFIKDMFIRPF
jgi:exopolysaccharide biosynthesis WecB/TagA/CpsF family protein